MRSIASFPNSALLDIRDMAPKNTLKLSAITGLVAIIVARFSPWLNCPCRFTDSNGKIRGSAWLGRYGEKVAASWLKSQRHRILATNFRGHRRGEVDIIASDGSLLLFVEVKTRSKGGSIRPLDAVTRDKQALIQRGANAWLKRLGRRDIKWRFDVIEVLAEDGCKPEVRHIRNAF